jgi:HAD superfamily phosphoserine phosphatase-like hydrolase
LASLINEPILHRLRTAQSAGHHVLILSSSPDFLVSEIASRLNVGSWKATSYQVNDHGKFDTISHVMGGYDKAEYVAEMSQQLSIPLNFVTVYSDSALDLPLLTIVGEAICVRPDDRLKGLCKQNGWEIIF